jgi:hypothetical protein
MTVQQLIDQLQQLDPNKKVYLGDNDLDEDTYYYQALEATEHTTYDHDYKKNVDIVVITYRR